MSLYQTARLTAAPAWPRLVGLATALLLGCRQSAGAGTAPLLEFDAPFCISCRGIPGNGPAKRDSGKDLVEVVIPISVRLHAGAEKDLKQCLYTLVDPTKPGTVSVRDWLPRTELRTEFAKPIRFNNERLAKVGITVSAHYVVTAAADAAGQIKSGVAYEMLPPKELVLASGTVHQGHGVFFKLKPSTQTALEGMKSFSAILAVPRGWRGGCLILRCEAVGLNRGLVQKLDREVESGLALFCLALHLAGDDEAEKRADQVAVCQQELFDCLVKNRREVRQACDKALPWLGRSGGWPSFFDRLRSGSDAVPARIEAALLNYALDRATRQRPVEEFPRPIREKLRALQEATEALQSLSTGGPLAGYGLNKERTAAAAGLPVANPDNHRDGRAGPSAGSSRSPGGGSSAKPLAGAGNRNEPGTETATPLEEACKPGQPPKAVPKQAWYLLAWIGGALFTCVLALLAVDVIRKRIQDRRQHRSKGKRTPSPLSSVRPVNRVFARSGGSPR
jgi:hypothetical protein